MVRRSGTISGVWFRCRACQVHGNFYLREEKENEQENSMDHGNCHYVGAAGHPTGSDQRLRTVCYRLLCDAVLAVSVLVGGWGTGITVALVSPVLAFLLNIAPQILTVPAIMAGNTVYVVLMRLIAGGTGSSVAKRVAAWLVAAAAKFGVLYLIVVKLICGVMAPALLESGALKEPMLKALPATFSYPQLITALIGGAVALAIVPVLRKALHK